MHHNGCNHLSMLGLKLNHVSKRGHRELFGDHWTTHPSWKRNCSKLRKIHSGQGYTRFPSVLPSEFELVKPFVLLWFIYEWTDRYKVFPMTHSWQLYIYAVATCAKFVVIWWSEIKLRQNNFFITFHMWLEIAREMGPRSYKTTESEESRPIMERKMFISPLIMHIHNQSSIW